METQKKAVFDPQEPVLSNSFHSVYANFPGWILNKYFPDQLRGNKSEH